eukprot:CAMPEP_0116935164 /NCGR_PEP_ID=MMETSP0467-20121206/30100_1 /TAXON_ID=283647 /ORGANISM="Mesodinium pulex, Strain SPMC105" /LENGTH=47 /DNA_ID= /DNA_START= /DNA_END= /DNA_ORIENTATION=
MNVDVNQWNKLDCETIEMSDLKQNKGCQTNLELNSLILDKYDHTNKD